MLTLNISIGQESFNDRYPTLVKQYGKILEYNTDLSELPKLLRLMQDTLINNKQTYLLPSLIPLYLKLEDNSKATPILIAKEYTKLGYVLKSMESLIDPAIKIYEKAKFYSKKNSERDDYWYVENALATLYNMKGDHEKSILNYQEAHEGLTKLIAEKTEKSSVYQDQWLRLQNNIGYLYFWNKEYEKAASILTTNILKAKKESNYTALVVGYRFLSELYLNWDSINKIEALLPSYRQALDSLPESKKKNELNLYHVGLGNLLFKAGKTNEATIEYQKSVAEFSFDRRDRFVAKNFNRLAKSYLETRRFDEAGITLQNGFRALQMHYPSLLQNSIDRSEENTVAELLETQTQLYMKKYEQQLNEILLDSAMMVSTRALDVYEQMRLKLAMDGSKILIAADQRRVVENVLEIIEKKYNKNPEKWMNESRRFIPLLKNTLQSDLEAERFYIEKSQSPELIELLEEIRTLTSINESTEDTESILKNNASILRHRARIQSILPENTKDREVKKKSYPFVEFVIVGENLWRIDNLSDKEKLSHLGNIQKMGQLAEQIKSAMLSKSDTVYPLLEDMYRHLFAGLTRLPSKIGIIADGFLLDFPFAALIIEKEPRTYLIQKTEIYHVIERNYTTKRSNQKSNIAIISTDYAKDRQLSPLPFAKQEAAAISKVLPDHQMIRNVDKKQFFDLLSDYGMVHYNGHALIRNTRPYLAISDDDDQWITVEEIIRAPVATQTIVLAACDTGQGSYRSGEGIYSIAKAFINAGSQTVVSTLWQVNDQITSSLMADVYTHFSAHQDMTKAVNVAQKSHLASANGAALHPYYWAGITVAESGIPSQNYKWIYILCGMALLAGIIYFIYKIKAK